MKQNSEASTKRGRGRSSRISEDDAKQMIRRGARAVVSLEPSIQMEKELDQVIEDGKRASERGYFTPDEDERVLTAFGGYLRTRNILYGTILEIEMILRRFKKNHDMRVEAYAVGVAAASLLIRAGEFVVGYKSKSVVARKLDQGEPRYGIPKKQFTRIYYSLTKTYNIYRFHLGVRFILEHWKDVEKLKEDPELKPIVEVLGREHPESSLRTKRLYALNRLGYFKYSLSRRHKSTLKHAVFAVYQMFGRVIANLRNPFRRKRVTAEIRERLSELLRPGDVIITRHDDAMTNYFLPGFWPHAALYIGLADERRGLGVEIDESRWEKSAPPIRVLEARRDGVNFRTLKDTLSVDSFVVVRPQLEREVLAQALSRAISHEGKAYNFEFDFTEGHRLACTELVYRAYHALGPIKFRLSRRLRRQNLSAEDILDHAVEGRGFEVLALFGAKGLPFLSGKEALEGLKTTYKSAACAVEPEGGENPQENSLPETSSAVS